MTRLEIELTTFYITGEVRQSKGKVLLGKVDKGIGQSKGKELLRKVDKGIEQGYFLLNFLSLNAFTKTLLTEIYIYYSSIKFL